MCVCVMGGWEGIIIKRSVHVGEGMISYERVVRLSNDREPVWPGGKALG